MTQPANDGGLLQTALNVVELDVPVFPLKAQSKLPLERRSWKKDATTNPAILRAIWNLSDRAAQQDGAPGTTSYGILWSGLIVDGDDPLRVDTLEATFPELAEAPTVVTPRGGRHWYLRWDGAPLPTRAEAQDHVDVRGFGKAYVVGPGSQIVDDQGARWYTILRPLVRLEDAPLASAALREYLSPRKATRAAPEPVQRTTGSAPLEKDARWAARALAAELEKVRTAQEGSRNETLNKAAFSLGQIVGAGYMTEDEALTQLVAAARGAGLGEREALTTAESGLMAGIQQPRGPKRRKEPAKAMKSAPAGGATDRLEARRSYGLMAKADAQLAWYPDSDLGNAERLAYYCQAHLRYANGVGWLQWIGTHWEPDGDRELVLRLASATIRATAATAELLEDGERRKSLRQHARASESLGRLRAMADLARVQPELMVEASALDADPWTLNVTNGLLDLRTGTLRAHDPAALCTRMAPVRYEMNARHPALDKLLEVLARDGRAEYLRAIAGQALTGRSAKAIYIWTGPSGTAKSSTADALAAVLGPNYAVPVEPSTLLVNRHGSSPGGARADLVALRGARLAIAAELPNGGRLDGELVKRLTGRDPITARAPYAREMLTFTPGHTLVVHSNHDPRIDWTDDGMRHRVVPIPFTVRPEQPDPRIRAALVNDPDARTAVLAWAIAGAIAWHQNGERDPDPPELVRSRKVEYLREMDPFAAWADDALEPTGDATFISTAALAESYRRWCEANGETPLGTKALGPWLRDNAEALKITAARSSGPGGARGRGWTGLRLKNTRRA